MSDEAMDVIKHAERAGWTVSATAKSHRRFVSPEGGIVIHSGTTGDVRSIRNLKGRLKREGLEVGGERRTAKTRHPSATAIDKIIVPTRKMNPRVLQASVYALLEDGPLSEGMLVHALRSEGVKVVAGDLVAPLRALVQRGAVQQTGAEYERVRARARRPIQPVKPPPLPSGTTGPVWCCVRKGAWHCTQHNSRPTVAFRSLCGYALPATEEFERRRPDCPYCLEKLELVTFL